MIDLNTVGLDYLEIGPRALRALPLNGILSAGQIDGLSDAQLLDIPEIGAITLSEIRDAVETLRGNIHRGNFRRY